MYLDSPCLYYIKYLFLKEQGADCHHIKRLLDEKMLDSLSIDYLRRAQNKLVPPAVFRPQQKGHILSQQYLLEQGVYRLFHQDPSIKLALDLLSKPRAKEFLEAMTLSGASPKYIADVLVRSKRFGKCTEEVVEQYLHFFWNIDLVDASQMRVVLQLRFRDFEGDVEMASLLKKSYYQDSRQVAADLPFSATSAMLAQMRMGIRPGNAEIADQMLEARKATILKALEAAQRDGPNDSKRALDYFQSAKLLTELLETIVTPDDNLHEQLRAVALRTDTKPLPSIRQMGTHSVDAGPKNGVKFNYDEKGDAADEPEG